MNLSSFFNESKAALAGLGALGVAFFGGWGFYELKKAIVSEVVSEVNGYTDKRFDALESRMDAGFDEMQRRMCLISAEVLRLSTQYTQDATSTELPAPHLNGTTGCKKYLLIVN